MLIEISNKLKTIFFIWYRIFSEWLLVITVFKSFITLDKMLKVSSDKGEICICNGFCSWLLLSRGYKKIILKSFTLKSIKSHIYKNLAKHSNYFKLYIVYGYWQSFLFSQIVYQLLVSENALFEYITMGLH